MLSTAILNNNCNFELNFHLFICLQEIKVTQDFLRVLNGQVASQMSILLFVFIEGFTFGKFSCVEIQNRIINLHWLFSEII